MAGIRTEQPAAPRANKRPSESDHHDGQRPAKRLRMVRRIFKSPVPPPPDPAASEIPDEEFVNATLVRSLGHMLQQAGFDSAHHLAMEAMRAKVEEFMRDFASDISGSMKAHRRTSPTPHDFIQALALSGLTASDLMPHIKSPPPKSPSPFEVAPPTADEIPAPDLEILFAGALSGVPETEKRSYIPAHLPPLPSKHTWQSTPVYQERLVDPRRIREQATQEGVLAEQALRKLMAARRVGLAKATHHKPERVTRDRQIFEEALREAQHDDKVAEDERQSDYMHEDFDMEQPPSLPGFDDVMLVNYERNVWRKAGMKKA
ncbi:hypothetical protein EJ06DRAFT_530347 [Trichodelitschia bisporula]|uniref:Transcription initiation factor TFIID subunit 8 n=1 Tax=Trichodelitschia bisporula TaxID=703511 RepID=A0A6G1HXA1_9PEZI|nr:hypothetical protein EJ06DRAFT_530347 [Trichodelitschia bisporula]